MDDTVLPTTLLVAGGVYRRETPEGQVEEAVCISTVEKADGKWGLFRRCGFSDERFKEGAEDLGTWTLTWGPGVKVSTRTGKPTRKYDKQTDSAK